MTFSTMIASFLLLVVSASAAGTRGLALNGLPTICPNLNTLDKGCIRYVQGFDVTGVTTEVDLTFKKDKVKNVCDCIQQCLNRVGTCTSWVYKFSTPASVKKGHRTCTLYSNFNLPSNVAIAYDVNHSTNIQLLQPGNNPQAGGLVPQAFMDVNLNTTADNLAYSGGLWALSNGHTIC
jgi:hypothetical protein